MTIFGVERAMVYRSSGKIEVWLLLSDAAVVVPVQALLEIRCAISRDDSFSAVFKECDRATVSDRKGGAWANLVFEPQGGAASAWHEWVREAALQDRLTSVLLRFHDGASEIHFRRMPNRAIFCPETVAPSVAQQET